MNLFQLSVRSTLSSLSAFPKSWIRCISTNPGFVRPPGPVSSWTREEQNAWRRWKYATDADVRTRRKEHNDKYTQKPDSIQARKQFFAEKYANDAAFRLRRLQNAAKWRADPANREALSQLMKDRYVGDPDYRKTVNEYRANWRAVPENRIAEAEHRRMRYKNDPEYRERLKQYKKEFREREERPDLLDLGPVDQSPENISTH